ncbi:glycosyltransferase family 2 protein [Caminibacter pacificus]|uniref:Glycosyl transferase family 2 n=1 Tax=Caminibacter pacificus TaxID=1424653 RepID=A0AAJ4UXA0_9BACT|nr:glycosyltransferase family 2 protein [Caminibacter pacificus]QCI29078.1 glycosyltransferase [Caminibacter pacificus]ROR39101.1 glycosyl transferase family 2 [Caminibacter pacificus]
MIDYFFHKIKTPVKICFVMVVKDEEEKIRESIIFHHNLGVDNFVIVDNGSTDNTIDIIKELQKDISIELLHQPGILQQAKFMTKAIKLAKRKYNPDWVINSDVDEFWVPIDKNKSLKDILNFKGGVLFVRRNNMVMYHGLKNWKEAKYRVANPICREENFKNNFLLGKIGRKVIVNPHGYFKTNTGNHSAEHIAFWKKKELKDLLIYHYPMRGWKYFENNVKNRINVLKNGGKSGAQYKKYMKAYEAGKLKELYESMFLSLSEVECLKKMNILKEDTTIIDFFKKFNLY